MKNLVALVLLACAGTLQAAEHFLEQGEIDKLQPHPDVPGLSRYITPGKDPAAYGKLLVGSVTFYFADDSKEKGMDADEMKWIADAMRSALVAAAAEEAEAVLEPGPGVALINVAITEIDMQNKKRGLLGYTPIGFVATSAANASGSRIQLKDAKIEGELVDSQSGERLSVFRIDKIESAEGEKELSWTDLRTATQSALTKALEARATP